MKSMPSPRTALDSAAFEKLRRIAPNFLAGQHAARSGEWQARPVPEEVAFKLTNRCDLRCSHCYQWNEQGYHRQLAPDARGGDLELAVIARVLQATRERKSNVYLWGGEPLVYRDWDGLCELLAADPRWTSICTNGTLIEKRLDSLVRISDQLEVSVSIDGFEAEHDAVRGKGSWGRTLAGLRALVGRKRAGAYRGEVTVNFLFTSPMVGRAFEFVSLLEQEGVDTVYVSFPWFLSDDAAHRMDDYYARHFGWAPAFGKPSWYSYNYSLDPALTGRLGEDIQRLNEASWRLKLRYNPELDSSELHAFVTGSDKPAQNKTRCQSISTRMDVFPDGEVVSCKFFPEFRVGNLAQQDVMDVWHGERFNQVRETVSRCGLMPVCAKCNLLYTRGA
jgi:radical SAM protein with 4Fe4S-binding SPASM domain